MDPEKWGYHGWNFIHNIALGYDETFSYQKKQNYINFFDVISDVIPCEKCSKHYKEYISKNRPNIKNKDSLFKWTVDIHNKVNERINKKQITLDEAYNIWKNTNIIEKKELTPDNKLYYLSLIFFLILLVCVLVILYFHTP